MELKKNAGKGKSEDGAVTGLELELDENFKEVDTRG